MSDPLTEASPSTEDDTTSVEDAGSDSSEAVANVSGQDGEKTIPVSRFNGLMATYNKYKSQAEQQLAELEAQLAAAKTATLTNQPQETTSVSDSDLAAKIDWLIQREARRESEARKAEVLANFPEISPFADLIVADDPDQYESIAKQLSDRVKSLQPVTEQAAESAEETGSLPAAKPEAPVIGRGTGGAPQGADVERTAVAEAIKARDLAGFIQAKLSAVGS